MECEEFGKFTLLDHMGKGGVASVYRAHDNEGGNIVAVKIFEPDDHRSEKTVRRLRDREVRMLISVQHPNVVKYYESGNVGESCYYTMEFVENSLLNRMRGDDELELVDKIHILRQASNALQAIHHQGIVHRDIKPGNILLDEDPSGAIHAKVTDLGIAKHVSETDAPRDDGSKKVPGTPKYLSPEQIRLKAVDGRADVFSLGVVAYEVLTGTTPFQAETSEEYLRANLNDEFDAIHRVNPDVPAFINPLLERMLAKDREGRYDSDTLARDLELTYQHLVSDSPLVEQRNPDSVYYVPPVSDLEEEKTETPESIWWRVAVFLIFALTAAYIVWARWPETPDLAEKSARVNLKDPAAPDVERGLEQARSMTESGRHWEALAVLESLNREEMNQGERNEIDEFRQQIAARIATLPYEVGTDFVTEGYLDEAEILAEYLDSVLWAEEQAEDLRTVAKKEREKRAEKREWREKMGQIYEALGNDKPREVFPQIQRLNDEVDASNRKSETRKALIRCLNAWQKRLVNTDAEVKVENVKQCIDAVSEYIDRSWAEGNIDDLRPMLELTLAKQLVRNDRLEESMEKTKALINKHPDSDAADAARTLRRRVLASGRLPPMNLKDFARRLEAKQFDDSIWEINTPKSGEQDTVDGTLVFNHNGTGDKEENYRRFIRPVEITSSFRISLEFRARHDPDNEKDSFVAGLRVNDPQNADLTVSFDGEEYRLIRHAGSISGGQKLRDATGEEQEKWHRIDFLYHAEDNTFSVYLEGEKTGTYRAELNVFMVNLFLRTDGEGKAQAAFRNLECKRVEKPEKDRDEEQTEGEDEEETTETDSPDAD
ncbi:MAG: serine/threonine-protein kinase [Planctomycetota bacterium]